MESFAFTFGIGFFGLRFIFDLKDGEGLHAIYSGAATALSIYALIR